MCFRCFRASPSSSKVIQSSAASSTASSSASSGTGCNDASDQNKRSPNGHLLNLHGGSSTSTGIGKSKRSPVQMQYGFSLVKGKSKHAMEDYHVAKFKCVRYGPHNVELGLFAIFDGHMGHNVSHYLQRHLFDSILKQPNFWDKPDSAIAEAYAAMDDDIMSNSKELGRGGSTAVTAIVAEGQKLVVANIGDSRAVLCRGGSAFQLSMDHDPGVEEELNSIQGLGGFVSNIPGDVPRVDGQLAVSRAFGDKSLKMHMRSDPYVTIENIDEATEFLILASDGLWKVVTNQEAVDLVRSIKNPQAAAKRLTSEALTRNSKDDISCIVVRFR